MSLTLRVSPLQWRSSLQFEEMNDDDDDERERHLDNRFTLEDIQVDGGRYRNTMASHTLIYPSQPSLSSARSSLESRWIALSISREDVSAGRGSLLMIQQSSPRSDDYYGHPRRQSHLSSLQAAKSAIQGQSLHHR